MPGVASGSLACGQLSLSSPPSHVLQVRGHLEGEAAFGHTQFPGEVGGGDRRALWPGRPAEAVPPRSGQGAHVPPHTDTPT